MTHDVDGVHSVTSMFVAMRDTIRLSMDVYGPLEDIARPVILIRTPYDKGEYRAGWHQPSSLPGIHREPGHNWGLVRHFVDHGYVVVVQDMRGKYESEGCFAQGLGDADDGYDTIEHIAAQPWCTGAVGTIGCSYRGEVQLWQAAKLPPSLKAMVPQSAANAAGSICGINGYGNFLGAGPFWLSGAVEWYRNSLSKVNYGPPPGIDREAFFRSPAARLFQSQPQLEPIDPDAAYAIRPVVDIQRRLGSPPTDWEDFVTRPIGDPWWDRRDHLKVDDTIGVPCLLVESWNDPAPIDGLRLREHFERVAANGQARDNQFVVVDPGDHCGHCHRGATTREITVGDRVLRNVGFDYLALYLRWFDRWLKGVDTGIEHEPRVRYYVIGAERWDSAACWPPERATMIPHYLRAGDTGPEAPANGRLDTVAPAAEPADRFASDPENPVPSVGGGFVPISGFARQDVLDGRTDVLRYDSAPLPAPLELAGNVVAVLYVAASVPDIDVAVKLIDLDPSGSGIYIAEGILRLRHRHARDRVDWLEPGKPVCVRIEVGAIAIRLEAGHRLRVQIAGSSFPRWDRNWQTGGRNWDEVSGRIADIDIFHDAERPSHLILPVIGPEMSPRLDGPAEGSGGTPGE